MSQTSQQFALISIHASAKEATRGGWLHNLQCRFQSTPPRRRRRTVDIVVDIVDNHFNPRLREGGDEKDSVKVGESFEFQSTPPRRRRPSKCKHRLTVFFISIHASAKEATSMIALDKLLSIFQSTPPRRRRQWTDCLYSSGQRFQSTPPRRRRPRFIC